MERPVYRNGGSTYSRSQDDHYGDTNKSRICETDAEEEGLYRPARNKVGRHAGHESAGYHGRNASGHCSDDVNGIGAERQTEAQFPLTLRDVISQGAIEPYRRQQQRNSSKSTGESGMFASIDCSALRRDSTIASGELRV